MPPIEFKATVTSLAAKLPSPDTVRLTLALQTTLELEAMLALFMAEVSAYVSCDALVLRSPVRNLELEMGKPGRHRCAYNLTLQDEPLGEIEFSRDRLFGEADLNRLEVLLSALAYPLRNALVYREALRAARRDALTQVGNRAAFEEALAREASLAKRRGQPLALLALDLDNFKGVNDLHGHQAGDGVLRDTAMRMQEAIRATDQLFRYGGEEFVVLLGNTDQHGAELVAERIRNAVAVGSAARGLQVTVSIGLALLGRTDDVSTLFAKADMALYQAKAMGRNRVTVHREEAVA
ncbi:MAG: GGDEF domain-containing protein [Gammaproteobacteria bacterium]|nr:GGDEF domain-containing protein [Gammaproteobacteria bacterium]